MIHITGMIGLGKTTVAELIAKEFNSQVFYESVNKEENPILPLFYTLSEEELLKQRIPFLLQLHFLHTRIESIRQAKKNRFNVLDRSLEEDEYFATVNYELGRISDLELTIYKQLKKTLLLDIEESPYSKTPDLFVYLRASFETVMHRISLRGREFEQDEKLVDYYYKLWSGYDDWVFNKFKNNHILVFDMDQLDVVKRPGDAQFIIQRVKEKLDEIHKEKYPQ